MSRQQIAFVGLSGTGKTTVGHMVADRLGVAFGDTDDGCEALMGCTIAAAFADHGEPWFRSHELETVAQMTTDDRYPVLAVGAGAVQHPAVRTMLIDRCEVFWLRAPPLHLARRLEGDTEVRPLFFGQDRRTVLEAQLAERGRWYEEVADWVLLSTGFTAAETADAVLALVTAGAGR